MIISIATYSFYMYISEHILEWAFVLVFAIISALLLYHGKRSRKEAKTEGIKEGIILAASSFDKRKEKAEFIKELGSPFVSLLLTPKPNKEAKQTISTVNTDTKLTKDIKSDIRTEKVELKAEPKEEKHFVEPEKPKRREIILHRGKDRRHLI